MFAASAACLVLAACGGGGVNSTPSPAPAPAPTPSPTPTPAQTISDLRTDQTFTTTNASVDTTFNLDSKGVVAATPLTGAVTVAYDAGSKCYRVSAHGQSQSFGPGAIIQAGNHPGETRYRTTSGSATDLLTLATTPYTGTTPNKHVGLGYWQRLQVTGSTQANSIDMFVYGFATPASAVPRSGAATYATDAFGLLTWPNQEPMVISGSGTFDVDLKSGAFRSSALVGEFSLASWNYAIGGQLVLQSGGTIGSGNSFAGNFSFTDLTGTIGGDLQGGFFGPTAQELGASFSGRNAAGATLTGAMTGQLNPGAKTPSLVLGNIYSETVFPEYFAEFTAYYDTTLPRPFREASGAVVNLPGSVTLRPDGSAVVHPYLSHFGEVTLDEAHRSAVQKPNFDSYDVLLAATATNLEAAVHVDLAKRGSANGQIALTYTGYGAWTQATGNGTFSQTTKKFFVYGAETAPYMLAPRNGSASYSGIVLGTATTDGVLRDLDGTSSFNVDFGAQTYSGSLVLSAQTTTGIEALGTWTFSDALARGMFNATSLNQSGVSRPGWLDPANRIQPHFYGPTGEEIAAPFSIVTGQPGAPGTLAVAGVAVAKRN